MPDTFLPTDPASSRNALHLRARAGRKALWLAALGLILAGTSATAATTIANDQSPAPARPGQAETSQPSQRTQARKQPQGGRYAGKPAAEELAREIAQRNDWDVEWVRHWIGQSQQLPSVIRLVTPAPAAAKNWATYRARLIEPTRIEAGKRFWQTQRAALERAEASYGVPAWLVVGVIGVETLYGRHTGNYRVLDALATLSLDFPSSHPRAAERQAYFRGELETLLRLSRDQGLDPDSWRGSYAGAMGLPQFMPSSWARHAVDFDGDGRIDLRTNAADAIGSVAHYLRQHGWQSGMPTHYPVKVEASDAELATLLAPDIKPSFDAARFQALGARLAGQALQHAGPLALVELKNGDPLQGGAAPSFVAGTGNFYVVTRYNWSSYYALAVIELGQAVQAALAEPNAAR
ncbi:lytic murein transglycosylase B [Malikia sp.]|uniref:lytic murein transglycosylase B n=1 Tax=Malikia sp. TaxID=2070706 RepID=UPI00262AB113|nr:lytic murein transglycosylase B [Malikia sp.]MDD2729900.1 lytic murein transglycosylase B [Malikia sp.]